MLLNLQIKDFVIVDECQLEFAGGFTVFSGETGAGKSILIDALALALGERTEAAMVRQGAAKADVTAGFRTSPALDVWLAEHELEGDEGIVLLRRTVDAQGRSRAFINGAPATQAMLRECGDMLVDIHGQHAHQILLKPSAQRNLLDTHAGLGPKLAQLGDLYRAWQAIRQQREQFEHNARSIAVERERLQWQHDDLAKLGAQPGEWAAVGLEHKRLSHAAGLIEGATRAVAALDEDEGAVVTVLNQVLTRLRPLADIDAALKNAVQALDGAQVEVADAVSTLNGYLSRTDLDPDRLAEIDARMQALHSAARKYRVAPEELNAEFERVAGELAALADSTDIEGLQRRENQARSAYMSLAQALRKARSEAASQLGREVTRAMQDLSMSGGKFVAALSEREPAAHGIDDIEFLVAGHAGTPPRPLAKVASGGELARISLASSVIASSATATPTLIFDEVDSGIGGAVAEVIGRLLRALGQSRQVLCVTHLAQVAACADQHFAVSKTDSKGATLSRVLALAPAQRVDEIARMLGGLEITSTTRSAAREMLAR